MESNQFQTSRLLKQNSRIADIYITHFRENVYDEIEEGNLAVASTEAPLDQLINKQQKKSTDHFRAFVKQELDELSQGYRRLGSKGVVDFWKEDHKKIVDRVISERKQDRGRRQWEKGQSENLRRKWGQSEERYKKQRNKMEKLRQRLLGIQKQISERKHTQEKAQIKYTKVRTQKTTHRRIQDSYYQPILQQEKQHRTTKIAQISQNNRQNSMQDILVHDKNYLSYLDAEQTQPRTKLQQSPSQNSHRVQRVLEEENIKVRLKMEAKKRALLDREARLANFILYLKDQFCPNKKGDQSKLKSELKSELAKVEKVGLNKLGLGYLGEVRTLRKKQKVQSERHKTEQVRGADNPRRQSTEISISEQKSFPIKAILASGLSATDKCQKIKREMEQLQQRTAMTEQLLKVRYQEGESQQLTELLLLEVQAKLAILKLQV